MKAVMICKRCVQQNNLSPSSHHSTLPTHTVAIPFPVSVHGTPIFLVSKLKQPVKIAGLELHNHLKSSSTASCLTLRELL